jgi:nucleotide-binding universal stress UspA family protein
MTSQRTPRGVLVAVEGDSAADAVEWAAAEAAARRTSLHVVHTFRRPLTVDPSGLIPAAQPADVPIAAARVLCTAVERARAVAPELPISADLVHGPPVQVLVAASRSAGLLVVGKRPRSVVRGRLSGSVALRVSAAARCPVVVIGSRSAVRPDRTRPRVVVGVDSRESCPAALRFAFRAAAQRGIPLRAVHAWKRDTPADVEGIAGSPEDGEARAWDMLDRVLSACWDRFPDVPVETQVISADPATALIEESRGAALVVVGCRRRGSVRARVFGSVSRTVLLDAQIPVAVVSGIEEQVRIDTRRRRHRSSMTDAV